MSLVTAFKEKSCPFPCYASSEAISSSPHCRQLTRDVLRDWEIDVTRISRILTDNGSNMVAAFRENSQIIAEQKESENEVEEEEEEEEVEVEEVIAIEKEAEVGVEDELDSKDEEMECDSSDILKEIESFYTAENHHNSVFASLNRLSCFSHTLQLVARQFDASASAKKVLSKVYCLVKRFSKSGKATEKLITLSRKKLLSHCPTRWSSTHIVVSRLLGVSPILLSNTCHWCMPRVGMELSF